MEEIEKAAEAASANDFIQQLDEKYNSMIGTLEWCGGPSDRETCDVRAAIRRAIERSVGLPPRVRSRGGSRAGLLVN